MTKQRIASKFFKKSARKLKTTNQDKLKLEIVETSPEVQKEMKEIANILTTENGFSPAFEDTVLKAASEDQSLPPFGNMEDSIAFLHKEAKKGF